MRERFRLLQLGREIWSAGKWVGHNADLGVAADSVHQLGVSLG